MIAALIKLADHLDSNGRHEVAEALDTLISMAAVDGSISAKDLLKLKPDVMTALKDAITFDLVLEKDQEGDGNSVKAVPKIHDKWTDGLNLGDIENSPKLQKFLTEESFDQLHGDKPMLGDTEFEYIPSDKDRKDFEETLRKLPKQQIDTEEFIDPSARSEEGQRKYDIRQRQLENLQRGREKRSPQQVETQPPPMPAQPRYPTVQPGEGASNYYGTTGADDDWHQRLEERRLEQKWEDLFNKYRTSEELINGLIKMADEADQRGDSKWAAELDEMIRSFAQNKDLISKYMTKRASHRQVSAKDIVQVNPGMLNKLLEAITFELDLQNTPQGKIVSGVPVINEQQLMFTDPNAGAYFELPPSVVRKSDESAEDLIENIMTPEAKREQAERALQPPAEQPLPAQDVQQWGRVSPADVRRMSPEQKERMKSTRKELGFTPKQVEQVIENSPMIPEEERELPMLAPNQFKQVKTQKILDSLVRLADKLDGEGQFELAASVDRTIEALAARPKAPLKDLNDDVKKSLIVFLGDAHNNMSNSVSGLNELFRRLRYFDISDSIKDLGLDRVVKDMEKTQNCLDSAKKDFYTMTYGKRPSKKDIEDLLGGSGEADDGQAALDFFNSQSGNEEELLGAFRAGPDGVDEEQDLPDASEEKDELDKAQWGTLEVEEEDDEDLDELLEEFWDEDEDEGE